MKRTTTSSIASPERLRNRTLRTEPPLNTSHQWQPLKVQASPRLRQCWGMTPERVLASADLLGQPDENALGASDVAEPIHVFVIDIFVDELRAVLAEPGERIVEVVHGEHDTQIAESVHRGVPVIGDHRRRRNRESSIRPWPSGVR